MHTKHLHLSGFQCRAKSVEGNGTFSFYTMQILSSALMLTVWKAPVIQILAADAP
jgi:hypothetical protein